MNNSSNNNNKGKKKFGVNNYNNKKTGIKVDNSANITLKIEETNKNQNELNVEKVVKEIKPEINKIVEDTFEDDKLIKINEELTKTKATDDTDINLVNHKTTKKEVEPSPSLNIDKEMKLAIEYGANPSTIAKKYKFTEDELIKAVKNWNNKTVKSKEEALEVLKNHSSWDIENLLK